MRSSLVGHKACLLSYWMWLSTREQAHNQTLLEGSKPGMVTQMNLKWGPLFVRISMCIAYVLGVYLK